MVDYRFIEKIVRHHNFRVDIFPLYGDSIRIEFYDGDSMGFYEGRGVRAIYEYRLKTTNCYAYKNNETKFFEFIRYVYVMVYDHFVNHMMTDVDEFKYVWDLFVKEFNEDIIVKVHECINDLRKFVPIMVNFDMGYILFPSYRDFMVLICGEYSIYEKPVHKISVCELVPYKYSCGEYHAVRLEFDLSNISF